jgi:transcriptional regulator with XRE-family HTH domain
MQSNKRSQLRRKSGLRIGEKVRDLRLARRWSQAELAKRLGLSQARLSEIERGAGSFTAEQFIELLGLFNVTVGHFAPADQPPDAELQNALVRLGATHLFATNAVPTDRVRDVNGAVRETLVEGSPRLVTALAPVLVSNSKEVNLRRIEGSLREVGLDNRLGWWRTSPRRLSSTSQREDHRAMHRAGTVARPSCSTRFSRRRLHRTASSSGRRPTFSTTTFEASRH